MYISHIYSTCIYTSSVLAIACVLHTCICVPTEFSLLVYDMIYIYLVGPCPCHAGVVGFNRQMYDFGEKEMARICVVLLQGKLTENVDLQIATYSGTAIGQSYMYKTKSISLKC